MRSLASYILAALVIGMALDFIAPAASSSNRWPTVELAQPTVNRDGKSDRLDMSGKANVNRANVNKTVRDFAPAPSQAPSPATRPVPEGCDPAFSPLSASARLNYPSRCVANNSIEHRKVA